MMTNNNDLPYERPAGWKRFVGKRGARSWMVLGWLLAVASAVLFGYVYVTTDEDFGILAVVGIMIGLVVAALNTDRRHVYGSPPAVGEIEGELGYVFRELRSTLTASRLFMVAGVVCTALSLLVLLTRVIGHGGGFDDIAWGIGVVVFSAAVAVSGWWLIRGARAAQRGVGAEPALVLTPTTLTYRTRGEETTLPWSKVEAIEAPQSATEAMQFDGVKPAFAVPGLRIRGYDKTMWRVRARGGNTLAGHLDNLEVNPWLVYTTVRFYLEHAALRTELATAIAGERMQGWNHQIAALTSRGR